LEAGKQWGSWEGDLLQRRLREEEEREIVRRRGVEEGKVEGGK